MMVQCISMESWADVVKGEACALLVSRPVPYGSLFRVYMGDRFMPSFLDGRHKFVSLGCARYGFRKYICKVLVERATSV